MPSISYDSYTTWTNYHLTSGTVNAPDLEPCVKVEDMGRIHAADLGMVSGLERFAATARMLFGHLGRVAYLTTRKQLSGELGDFNAPFPATTVGRGWSFSRIIGADKYRKRESMLMCEGLSGMIMLGEDDLAEDAKHLAGRVAMVSGGTRLRELAEWAHGYGLTIKTSGTHLGATIAGAFATASHGSRLGYGGIQDMILGMHLVTGLSLAKSGQLRDCLGDAVWIQRSAPLLGEAAIARLNPVETLPGGTRVTPHGFRPITNDEQFEDALVHLGCMGLVNAVAIELVPEQELEVLRWIKPVDTEWLALTAAGDWRAIARWLGRDEEPVFYETTLNPHDWAGASALHTMYFPAGAESLAVHAPSPPKSVGDGIAAFAGKFSAPESAKLNQQLLDALADIEANHETDQDSLLQVGPPARMKVFDPTSDAKSAYEFYQITSRFSANPEPKRGTWRQLHGDEITGAYPGALYNCSYAIAQGDLEAAVPAICAAVQDLPMSFVFTIRFVDNPAGTLAFTRFPRNGVIEIDGLSPWICRKKLARLAQDAEFKANRRMLKYLEFSLPQGQRAVAQALDLAGISYSNHWGKRGFIDAEKVQADFGPLTDPQSRLSRWRRTRDELLMTPLGKAVFWNWGAVNMGLLDRPMVLPANLPKLDQDD